MSSSIFVLRDSRSDCGGNAMFWPTGGGYTTDLTKAAHYTKEQAERQHKSRPTDIPLPLEALQKLTRITVDHQYLPDEHSNHSPDAEYVIQHCRMWDGNDIYFQNDTSASNGDDVRTTNLTNATRYSKTEAIKRAATFNNAQIWPLQELVAIGRQSVSVKRIDTAAMAALSGITILEAE